MHPHLLVGHVPLEDVPVEPEVSDIVQVPEADIDGGGKIYGDGSRAFKLLGGPHHDLTVRVYPPYERIVFGVTNPQVYKLMPPRTKTGKWVFLHDQDDHEPYTPAEQRPTGPWGPVRDQSVVDSEWSRHARYQAADEEAIQKLIVAREAKVSSGT